MARFDYGGSVPDFIFTTATVGGVTNTMRLPTGAALTFYSAKTGGTQYTDLRLASAPSTPVSSIPVGTDGQIPDFQGPDGVTSMWATGGLTRVRMVSWSAFGSGGGTPGTPGANGADGSKIFWAGAAAPATSLGVAGDWAFRDNGAVYEKTGASTWTLRMNVTGPAGTGGGGTGTGSSGNVYMQPIWTGTGSHPARPTGPTYVIWRQPTAPLTSAGYAVAGDEWEPI